MSYVYLNLLYARDAVERALKLMQKKKGYTVEELKNELELANTEMMECLSEHAEIMRADGYSLTDTLGGEDCGDGKGYFGEGLCKHCRCSIKDGCCPYCDSGKRSSSHPKKKKG